MALDNDGALISAIVYVLLDTRIAYYGHLGNPHRRSRALRCRCGTQLS